MFNKTVMPLASILTACIVAMPSVSVSAADGILEQPVAVSINTGLSDYQKAANELYSSFVIDVNGDINYPETFAGARIEDDKLVISLTTDDTSSYRFLTDKYTCVIFNKVKYSYNELQTIYRDYINENDCFYYCAYVDVENNRAVIETNDKNYTSAMRVRSDLPIEFVVGEAFDLNSTPVYGGRRLKVNEVYYTVGAVGEDSNNKNCIICCGHGMAVGDKAYYGNSEVGVVSTVRYSDGGYGDYSIITLNDGIDITNESYILLSTRIELTGGYWAVENDGVYKYGIAGGQGTGRVKSINADVYHDLNENGVMDSGDISLKGMTLVDIVAGSYVDGDSGGPIYADVITDSNNKPTSGKLVGIYSGSSSTVFIYTPMMRVHGALPYYGEW